MVPQLDWDHTAGKQLQNVACIAYPNWNLDKDTFEGEATWGLMPLSSNINKKLTQQKQLNNSKTTIFINGCLNDKYLKYLTKNI